MSEYYYLKKDELIQEGDEVDASKKLAQKMGAIE